MHKSKKEINQVNHLQTWIMLIIIAFFITTVIFIFIGDLTVLRNKNIIKDWHLRIVFLILAFYTVARYINKIVKYFLKISVFYDRNRGICKLSNPLFIENMLNDLSID